MAEEPSKATTRLAALIAGGSAIGLFASLFSPWYGVDVKAGIRNIQQEIAHADKLAHQLHAKPPHLNAAAFVNGRLPKAPTVDAWTSFGYLDWVLAAGAVLGLFLMISALVAPSSRLTRRGAALVSVVATAGAGMCAVRIVDPIGTGALIEAGAILGLIAVVVLAVAGTIAAGRPEKRPRPVKKTAEA